MTDTIFQHKYWLSNPEGRGGINSYLPKISKFERLLNDHRSRKTAPIVSVEKITLPGRVETHLDDSVLCTGVEDAHKILYVTLKFSSHGNADGTEYHTWIGAAEEPGDVSIPIRDQ